MPDQQTGLAEKTATQPAQLNYFTQIRLLGHIIRERAAVSKILKTITRRWTERHRLFGHFIFLF